MRHFLDHLVNTTPRGLVDLIVIVVLIAFVASAARYLYLKSRTDVR